jgi:hypothetical protein
MILIFLSPAPRGEVPNQRSPAQPAAPVTPGAGLCDGAPSGMRPVRALTQGLVETDTRGDRDV